ncbi:chorismate mutase [Thermoplasma acidophilum]|uniref:chorismate mutase n=1 Tax=Thermoplasma acidophilum TaxID=2303 RepID=UPI0000166066|nr:chorismate mutase [Thermoplasma acidophilum]MCY0851121.1 chorismate mutase [Thermoplasma acidophilum]
MVHFIDLEDLRARVLENTRKLVLLMNERMALARQIAAIKNANGMQIRDPEREAAVRRALISENPLINLIFEATIVEQTGSPLMDRPVEISGNRDDLFLVLGLFLCRPGIEIHGSKIPDSFVSGCSISGGHTVPSSGACEDTVDIGSGFPVKMEENRMTIFPDLIRVKNRCNSIRVIF